ncbi:protease modulator HflC [Oceanotoga sp. DSM 15011]|jgi:membrane protease subunit HflC|uniref:protease modulator HflC n=1 Tax=Oceanotoga TaxID=1255275 RepID=UPI0021F3DCFE|nr:MULTISPECIES: protease modulator HflC [Oceanotoga]MDN5341829.1 modulator of FtsH protease HflC [Oceanotoga sp.]MDO7976690.1 protease modulator HflC [Oceanotoga teriensis]UYP00662.1 protease modulator HflC [Oceanotoga sp. DSM 15011]
MKNKIMLVLSLIIVFTVIFILFSSFYILDQTQQAAVLRFGEIKKIETEPGLHFKTPFIDNVDKFEKRIMIYDINPERLITADKKTIVVDTYALWKISNPKVFIESMRTVSTALTRIDDIIYSHVRDVIAKYNFEEILSKQRFNLLDEIKNRSENSLKEFGINIVDVRVKRTDLPQENTKAVYNRMNAERFSIAAQIRAEGKRESEKIKAEADKQVKIILSDARKESEIIRGTADASSIKIYSDAYSLDESFFELDKLTDIYKNSFKDSIITIPEDSPLLKYFHEVD